LVILPCSTTQRSYCSPDYKPLVEFLLSPKKF
jgi:hypothetical protein